MEPTLETNASCTSSATESQPHVTAHGDHEPLRAGPWRGADVAREGRVHAWQQQLCYWAAGDGGERSGERSESRCGAVRPGAATRDMFFFFAWHWARDCSKILFWNSLGVG